MNLVFPFFASASWNATSPKAIKNPDIIHYLCCKQTPRMLISFSMHSLYRINWFHFVWFWQPCLLCNEMWCGEGLTVSINAGQSADCRGQMKVFISSGAQRSLRHDSQCLHHGIACCNLRCLPRHYSITDTDSAIYILVCMHTGRGDLLIGGGGQNNCLTSRGATSIVSQETSHVTVFVQEELDEPCFFPHIAAHVEDRLRQSW